MNQQLSRKYETLIIPFDYNKNFLNCSKEEIHEYYTWFLNIKGQRLANLCNFLFGKQEGCLIEHNLKVIEMFLLNSVSTLQKPVEQYNQEKKNIPKNLEHFTRPEDYLFDQKTISICYDIGIFMGELIINLDDKIFWKLEKDDTFSDYGQPILSKKKSKFDVNPFIVTKNTAAKIHKGTYADEQLISFFKTWKRAFKVEE